MTAYRPIMKNETTILQYKDMIDAQNKKLLDNNINEDLGSLNWVVDLYSHFKDSGLARQNNFFIDLWPFYDKT